jgi:hypothetical protein
VLILFPRTKDFLGVSYPVRYYLGYAVIGPFFREETVTASYDFHVRYKDKGQWSDWIDLGEKQFSSYSRQPWKFSELKKVKYLSYTFRSLYSKMYKNPDKPAERFREMKVVNNYLRKTLLPAESDSAHVVYILKTYKDSKTREDTLLNLQFQTIER